MAGPIRVLMAGPIRVLVVDESAMIREFLRSTLSSQPDMRVADASDPYVARDRVLRERPDVITLDIEMPRMDGLAFLHKLMAAYPTPVVMFNRHTQSGADTTMKALELGAVDFVAKPAQNLREQLPALASEIVEKVRAAAGARVRRSQVNLENLQVPKKVGVDQLVALAKSAPRPCAPRQC